MVRASEEGTYAVSLSLAEYGLVAAYVGLEGLIGVPDPFEGLDEAQQAEVMEAASAGLQERGLLAIDEPGQSVELDAITAALVKATGLAERIVSLARKTEDAHGQRTIFIGPELIVEQEADAEHVSLTAVRDGEVLAQRAAAFLACEHAGGSVGEPFRLTLDLLAEAQRTASEPETCREVLMAGGVATEAASLLSDILGGPHQIGTLSVFAADRDGVALESLAFLTGPNASWRLQHSGTDEDEVVVQPATGQEIEAQVRAALQNVAREVLV